jgi:hypothetical protein
MMLKPQRFEFLQKPGRPLGEDGFRMTGRSPQGTALARVWLRRSEVWARNPDPRMGAVDWDVRCFVCEDSAFALQQEFTLRDLEGMLSGWEWPQKPAGLDAHRPNGDLVHDTVLAWALRATGYTPQAPSEPAQTVAPG